MSLEVLILEKISQLSYAHKKDFNYKINVINIKGICSIDFEGSIITIIPYEGTTKQFFNDTTELTKISKYLSNLYWNS